MTILVVLLPRVGIPSLTRVKTRVLCRLVHKVLGHLATHRPSSLLHVMLLVLLKEFQLAATHIRVLLTRLFLISYLFPDADSQHPLVRSGLSSPVECSSTPPHAPPHSLCVSCLLRSTGTSLWSPPWEPLASSRRSAEGA